MKQIKNIVFDFGGVIISFDREQAVKAFERIRSEGSGQFIREIPSAGDFSGSRKWEHGR